jgi:hypothetical protein
MKLVQFLLVAKELGLAVAIRRLNDVSDSAAGAQHHGTSVEQAGGAGGGRDPVGVTVVGHGDFGAERSPRGAGKDAESFASPQGADDVRAAAPAALAATAQAAGGRAVKGVLNSREAHGAPPLAPQGERGLLLPAAGGPFHGGPHH